MKWFSSKEKPFIKDLNIKVNNGKILTIFGSSGIGKSSLINVIAGVYESNLLFTGDIVLNNKKITNTLPEKRKIGLLLQDGVLFPHLSVEQNLIFGIKKSLTNKEKYLLINEHLIKANMEGFENRYPNTLSGGQKSRVACLRAILSEPDALLLDEPFSSIDPEQRNSFRLFVANQVREKKIPCILVTHDESDKLISDYSPLDLNKFSS
ncbi:ATP-binding cassette domain-containing protein [Alphaproteobacteria bacterium]|nr:ATP-binding cassette domain-containing protein [Alphaproteobacteria bacterium]